MFEPFAYQFFIRGLLAATLVGGLCGLIGVYIEAAGEALAPAD